MGVQICIDKETLVQYGWECSIVNDVTYESDEDGNEQEIDLSYLVATKGEHSFASYDTESLVVDCNLWGNNHKRLYDAGLFSVPHCVG